jgi:hypothetical protein
MITDIEFLPKGPLKLENFCRWWNVKNNKHTCIKQAPQKKTNTIAGLNIYIICSDRMHTFTYITMYVNVLCLFGCLPLFVKKWTDR